MLAISARLSHNARMTLFRPTTSLATASAVAALVGCGTELSTRIDPTLPSPAAAAFVRALVGDYSNAAQAQQNAAVPDLVLHVCPIWSDRVDGLWVYVEGASAATPDKPYRQRVYQVVDGNEADSVDARIYDFPEDPSKFAGAWKSARPLDAITPYLLVPRAGCTTTFQRSADGGWHGTMRAGECATDHNGAAYTQSEVTLKGKLLAAIDRGYDAAGAVVWEASPVPIEFVKK